MPIPRRPHLPARAADRGVAPLSRAAVAALFADACRAGPAPDGTCVRSRAEGETEQLNRCRWDVVLCLPLDDRPRLTPVAVSRWRAAARHVGLSPAEALAALGMPWPAEVSGRAAADDADAWGEVAEAIRRSPHYQEIARLSVLLRAAELVARLRHAGDARFPADGTWWRTPSGDRGQRPFWGRAPLDAFANAEPHGVTAALRWLEAEVLLLG